jgi:hypothetical protein
MDMVRGAMRDVTTYPACFLYRDAAGIRVPVTYRASWNDGFGARGWKLDATLDDPEIIASTRNTGLRLPTSVFVHDIFDHLLSGFAPSGHRAEAMALAQLALRTGADPTPDYRQMVEEDVVAGRVLGEPLRSFLPADLLRLLPEDAGLSGPVAMRRLRDQIGPEALTGRLVDRFFELGRSGHGHAIESCKKLMLDPSKRDERGLSLQQALDACDSDVEAAGAGFIEAVVTIGAEGCALTLGRERPAACVPGFRVEIG